MSKSLKLEGAGFIVVYKFVRVYVWPVEYPAHSSVPKITNFINIRYIIKVSALTGYNLEAVRVSNGHFSQFLLTMWPIVGHYPS